MERITTTATTDETLSSDLKASLLKMDLEDHVIAEARTAERLARLVVSMTEPNTLDAAYWKGAEASYRFMDGRADAVPLSERDASVRQLHLTVAIAVMGSMRLALEGGFGAQNMAQAFADISNHKEQLGVNAEATRRRAQMARVADGR